MTTVTIITPWQDHLEFARDYWLAMRHADAKVIVVDNGSAPPLPNAWRLDHNSGFSHACNVGLELARTDAVLFVNNDIFASSPDWLERLTEAMEPGVLVGAKMRNDPHAMVDGQPMPYLDGWCIGGMRDDLLELGGWDETLEEPAYYSDNLLCLEARAAGMSLREVRVGLHHKLNGTARRDSERTIMATAANRKRYENRARELLTMVAA